MSNTMQPYVSMPRVFWPVSTLWEKKKEMAREQGLAEGKAEGITQGKAEGKAEGKMEEKMKIARALKLQGLSDEQIASATYLSLKEIKAL